MPEGRLEISPIFFKISPKNFSKQKNSLKTHLNFHLKVFIRIFYHSLAFDGTMCSFKNFSKNCWKFFFVYSIAWKIKNIGLLEMGYSPKAKKFPRSEPKFPRNGGIFPKYGNTVKIINQLFSNFRSKLVLPEGRLDISAFFFKMKTHLNCH